MKARPYPTRDNIVIVRDNPETKSSGGIVIAQAQQTENEFATVFAVGPKVHDLKEGDRVVLHRHLNPKKVKYEGKDLEIHSVDDVLGVIEE